MESAVFNGYSHGLPPCLWLIINALNHASWWKLLIFSVIEATIIFTASGL